MKELRTAYAADCTRADISIAANGSRSGIRTLNETGAKDAGAAEPADRDVGRTGRGRARPPGRADRGGGVRRRDRTARPDVTALTYGATARHLRGTVTNWKQLGGRDLPIRMVSRVGPDSGSRRMFREKVLAGDQELGISSDDCRHDDDPVAKLPPLRGRYDGGTADPGERDRRRDRVRRARWRPEVPGDHGRDGRQRRTGFVEGRGRDVQVLGGRARVHLQGSGGGLADRRRSWITSARPRRDRCSRAAAWFLVAICRPGSVVSLRA